MDVFSTTWSAGKPLGCHSSVALIRHLRGHDAGAPTPASKVSPRCPRYGPCAGRRPGSSTPPGGAERAPRDRPRGVVAARRLAELLVRLELPGYSARWSG